jgi:hypothetical protein
MRNNDPTSHRQCIADISFWQNLQFPLSSAGIFIWMSVDEDEGMLIEDAASLFGRPAICGLGTRSFSMSKMSGVVIKFPAFCPVDCPKLIGHVHEERDAIDVSILRHIMFGSLTM